MTDAAQLDEVALKGGEGFEARLQQLREVIAQADKAKAIRAEAVEYLRSAKELELAAEKQLAKNKAEGERLRRATEAAEKAEAKFNRRYDALMKAAR
jgi:hypothetical protein